VRQWLFLLPFVEPVVSTETAFFTVCLGDRQLADSEETFDVCDKKMFWPHIALRTFKTATHHTIGQIVNFMAKNKLYISQCSKPFSILTAKATQHTIIRSKH